MNSTAIAFLVCRDEARCAARTAYAVWECKKTESLDIAVAEFGNTTTEMDQDLV